MENAEAWQIVETIINYYSPADGLYSSGQPNAAEFEAIREAGFQLVINLVPPDNPTALPNEDEIVQGLGMGYLAIPVIWSEPTRGDLEAFYKAMNENRDKKVYVHCEVNYRASSFVYLYRRNFLGTDEAQARQDLQWIWAPNPTWTKFIADNAPAA